jgi:hypothetical protein
VKHSAFIRPTVCKNSWYSIGALGEEPQLAPLTQITNFTRKSQLYNEYYFIWFNSRNEKSINMGTPEFAARDGRTAVLHARGDTPGQRTTIQKESKQRDKSVLRAVPQDCDRALPVFTYVQQKKETLKLLVIVVDRQAVATDITMWSVAIC